LRIAYFFHLTPTPLPRERGYYIDIQHLTPFSPGRRGQGEEVKSKIRAYFAVRLLRIILSECPVN